MIILNRLLALIVGAVLAAGGLLVIVEAIWAWTGSGFVWIPGREWLTSFKTTPWSDQLVVAISVGVGLLGLVLLIAQLRPHPRRVARFETDHDSWWLVRRSTENSLARRLATAMPTSPIKTRLDPRGRWRLKVSARAASSSRPALEALAKAELQRLHATNARVQVKTTGRAEG